MFDDIFPRWILFHCIIREIQDHIWDQFYLIILIFIRTSEMSAADSCIGISIRQYILLQQ